jgi:N-acetylglucosamine kinase-like BadF-type ATPase
VTIADQPAAMWITAAGYAAASRERFEKLMSAPASEFPGPVGIANDAVSIVMASPDEVVAVIAGTGSVAMARLASGTVLVRGGDEWVLADFGSAFWLGLLGLRAGYHAMEDGPETALEGAMKRRFYPLHKGRSQREAISSVARDLAGLGTDTKPMIASFAPEVTRQAELGDEVAQTLVRSAAEELASAAARVYRELATQAHPRLVPLRFLLSGSVGYSSPFYKEAFSTALDQFLFRFRESVGAISLDCQRNGLAQACRLAARLAKGQPMPALDGQYPWSVFE